MTDLEIPIVAPKPFEKYIDLVNDQDLIKSLKTSRESLVALLESIPKKKTGYRYAEGKWTIRQSLQHIIDAERVFAFRALWFSRNDGQALPGFDENNWAINATAEEREWNELIKEFKKQRSSTTLLFKSFTPNQLKASGFASNNLLTVSAIGYICSGHVEHHINIFRERYLPAL